MNGIDAALVVALFFTLVITIGIGGYLVARKPTFWVALGSALAAAAWPKIVEYILKRNTPTVEKQMAECVRRGGEWDNFRKKCRFK